MCLSLESGVVTRLEEARLGGVARPGGIGRLAIPERSRGEVRPKGEVRSEEGWPPHMFNNSGGRPLRNWSDLVIALSTSWN